MTAVELILFFVFLLVINAVIGGALAAIGVTGILASIVSCSLITVLFMDLARFFKKLSRGIVAAFAAAGATV